MKMSVIVIAMSVLTSLIGCPAEPEVLTFDYQGSDEGFLLASRAADTWNDVCDEHLISVHRFEKDSSQVPLIEQHGLVNGVNAGVTHSLDGFMGVGGCLPCVIWVDADFGSTFRYLVFVHEFGHGLGLEHTGDGIMMPRISDELADEDGNLVPGAIMPWQCAAVRR